MGSSRSGRFELPGTIISDYVLGGASNPRRLHILLHGYQQNAALLDRKLAPAIPPEDAYLALNGPYPLPERTETGFRVGFAWYFYNPATDEYYIDMRVATRLIAEAVRSLGFEDLPKTLIGFSQGGYLAPFAASELRGVTQVVGIACRFLVEELPGTPAFRVDAIHGTEDEITPCLPSRECHMALVRSGVQGKFIELPGVAHRITPEVVDALKTLL